MDANRTARGAWRRRPLLPRAMTLRGGPTVTSAPPWADEAPEARRIAEPAGATLPATAGEGADLAPAPRLRAGGCLCGAVRFETLGEPELVALCHCADCRKASGGNAVHYGVWPAAQVRLDARLGTHAGRSFCPSCGSHVAHVGTGTVTVLLGTLDEAPNDLVPQRELWTIRREPWAAPVPGALQFERDAP